jgi:hypothetical protein
MQKQAYDKLQYKCFSRQKKNEKYAIVKDQFVQVW